MGPGTRVVPDTSAVVAKHRALAVPRACVERRQQQMYDNNDRGEGDRA